MTDRSEDLQVLRDAHQLLMRRAAEVEEEMEDTNPGYWQSALVPRSEWYAHGVQGGLGGASGDLAALFTPEAAVELAKVFDSWRRKGLESPGNLNRVGGGETISLACLILGRPVRVGGSDMTAARALQKQWKDEAIDRE